MRFIRDARIALVAELYRRRGLPVRYQLGPVVAPPALEESLVARGYEVEPASWCRSRTRAASSRRRQQQRARSRWHGAVDEAWLAAHADAHGSDESGRRRVATYGRLLGGLGPRGLAVAVRQPNLGVAGVGFVVVENDPSHAGDPGRPSEPLPTSDGDGSNGKLQRHPKSC